jgi:predicted RNA-binding protein with TRAM domain
MSLKLQLRSFKGGLDLPVLKTMSYTRGAYSGGRGFGGPKPVEMGKEYDVQISEQGRQGDGVARIQGFIIFVKDAKMGETTRIKITRVGDRSANAQALGTVQAQAPETPGDDSATENTASTQSGTEAPKQAVVEKADLRDYKAPGRRKDI